MKRIFAGFIISVFFISQAFSATGWVKGKPLSSESPSDISTLVGENNAAVDLMLSKYRENCRLTYDTVAQFVVGAGGVMVSNSAGTTRLMLANTSATTVTWANIDTGSEASSTTYYAYAIASATTDTTFTVKISTSASAPSGVTYYRKLGSFYNDASSNITLVTNDDQPMKYYDSGWFAIAVNTTYTKIHSLGTTKLSVKVFISSSSDGSANCYEQPLYGGSSYYAGVSESALTTTQISVTTGTGYLLSHQLGNLTSGYARIILIALE